MKKSQNNNKEKTKKELGNLIEIRLGFNYDNYIYKFPGPIFNLITNNFIQNDNNLNPPKKGTKKSKIIVINNSSISC